MRRAARAGIALAAAAFVGMMSSGAAAAPSSARPAEFCIPILLPCATPTAPSPSPTPTSGTILPGLPDLGDPVAPPASSEPEAPTPEPSASAEPVNAVPDDGAPVFTQPPAQLGSDSLSFSGLKGIEIVTVPLADGSRVPALKITADLISIDGFALTVRRETGPTLATTADTMTLAGDVQVYLNSLTATTPDGQALTLGADTPPPNDGISPSLLRVTLGLVGATADSITYSNTNQHLSE
jgi:hypothetical protein